MLEPYLAPNVYTCLSPLRFSTCVERPLPANWNDRCACHQGPGRTRPRPSPARQAPGRWTGMTEPRRSRLAPPDHRCPDHWRHLLRHGPVRAGRDFRLRTFDASSPRGYRQNDAAPDILSGGGHPRKMVNAAALPCRMHGVCTGCVRGVTGPAACISARR